MSIQPGVGYIFTASSEGISLDTSEQFPTPDVVAVVCPFNLRQESSSSPSVYIFSAAPGMINSIIPQIGTAALFSQRLDQLPVPTTDFVFHVTTGYSYVYLEVGADYATPPTIFPVTDDTDVKYPRIVSFSTEQVSTDDEVYFLLASAYKDPALPNPAPVTIFQLTCGSQYADRIKLGSLTARYFFARS